MNTFDEIIQTKAYGDLSSSELEVIRELVSSEEEYNEMKAFYAGIDHLTVSAREEVSPSVKSSLNSVFQAKHPGINQNWSAPAEPEEKKIIPLYNRTLFRVAAILVLSAGVTTVWISLPEGKTAKNESTVLAARQEPATVDTQTTAKQPFPVNDHTGKEFTAQSTIPASEQAVQKKEPYVSDQADSGGQMPLPVSLPDYKISRSESSESAAASYSFSNEKAQTLYEAESKKEDISAKNILQSGMDADLNPDGHISYSTDYKPAIKTSDLLSLIEPSF